jgi:hypothetical protein
MFARGFLAMFVSNETVVGWKGKINVSVRFRGSSKCSVGRMFVRLLAWIGERNESCSFFVDLNAILECNWLRNVGKWG